MKNNLTAAEWQVLNEYITYGHFVLAIWHEHGILQDKVKILDTAREKFNDVVKEIEDYE